MTHFATCPHCGWQTKHTRASQARFVLRVHQTPGHHPWRRLAKECPRANEMRTMTPDEIAARWPSVRATVEERKAQVDVIMHDLADDLAKTVRRYLTAEPRARRLMAGTTDAYQEQERINRELGLIPQVAS